MNHRYPETDGLRELHKQWQDGMKAFRRIADGQFTESSEGIAHIAMASSIGDIALVPDPGYPFIRWVPCWPAVRRYLPLNEANHFARPDGIPDDVTRKAKVLDKLPQQPHRVAEPAFFDKVVRFARKHELAVCHDGPYSELPRRLPAASSGSQGLGVEFHSCSRPTI